MLHRCRIRRNKVSGVVRILVRNLCRYDVRFPLCRRPSDYLHDPGAARPIGLDLVRCLLPLYGCLRLGGQHRSGPRDLDRGCGLLE